MAAGDVSVRGVSAGGAGFSPGAGLGDGEGGGGRTSVADSPPGTRPARIGRSSGGTGWLRCMTRSAISAPMIADRSDVTVSVTTNCRTVSVTPPGSLGRGGGIICGIIICRVSVGIPSIGCIAETGIPPGRVGIAPDAAVGPTKGRPIAGAGRMPELGAMPGAMPGAEGGGTGIADPGSMAEISTTSLGSGRGGVIGITDMGRVGL